MDTKVIRECLNLALQNQQTFLETVKRLKTVGIERYTADLTRLEKMHYDAAGNSHNEPIELPSPPEIAQQFSEAEVRRAIAEIQQKITGYAEFLRQIMRAGVVSYAVYLDGAKAIYFGRKGEFWVENFPAAARPQATAGATAN